MNCFRQEAVLSKQYWYEVWERADYYEVHRSIRLDDSSFTYQPVLELVGDSKPTIMGSCYQPMMMGGSAEILYYFRN